jgi:hypothetical protein
MMKEIDLKYPFSKKFKVMSKVHVECYKEEDYGMPNLSRELRTWVNGGYRIVAHSVVEYQGIFYHYYTFVKE